LLILKAHFNFFFFQKEQITQGWMEVCSDSFNWSKTQGDKLIAKLVMGDMKCKKQVIMN